MGVEKLTQATLSTDLQRRIAEELKGDPSVSNRALAAALGCDPKIVRRVRAALEASGEIPAVEHVTDSLGRRQVARFETPIEVTPAPAPERTADEWRAVIDRLEAEADQLRADIEGLKQAREQAALAVAAGDETARAALEQTGRRLAAREAKLADTLAVLEAARRGLEEAEVREAEQRRAAKLAELEALSQERLAAARAVDDALEKLAEAIVAYKRVCDEQTRLAPEAGLSRRLFEYRDHCLATAASTHLYRLLPDLHHISWKERGSLVENDPVTRALAEGGDAACGQKL